MNDRIPYTYFIGWSELNAWYYGVRYAKNCNPTDLFNPYKTSSKIVKAFILAHGLPDVIEVRKTFNSVVLAKNHEDTVLRRLKVGLRKDFLNIRADSFKNLDITKVRHFSGSDNPIHRLLSTKEGRKLHSNATSIGTKLGHQEWKERNPEQYQNWLNNSNFIINNPGINPTNETRKKMSISQLKRFANLENRAFGRKHSECTLTKMRKPKGPQNLVECPHCKKSGGQGNFKRYHFDNCKVKTLCVDYQLETL